MQLNQYLKHKISLAFYERNDVVTIAHDLLGKVLVTNFEGKLTAVRIVETEAYNGALDKASHAYNNRRTKRTEVMFGHGGIAYVYLCYGIHYLFNVVTNLQEVPHAILIRAAEPLEGVDIMLERTDKIKHGFNLTRGPGNVSKALGIKVSHTGVSLLQNQLFIADDGVRYNLNEIIATPRIGVDYAAEDAFLPYRFIVKSNPYLSGKKVQNELNLL